MAWNKNLLWCDGDLDKGVYPLTSLTQHIVRVVLAGFLLSVPLSAQVSVFNVGLKSGANFASVTAT